MTEKFCVYCQEVTPHYMNQYGCFECCHCEPLNEGDYESDSSRDTYVLDGSDSDQTIFITPLIRRLSYPVKTTGQVPDHFYITYIYNNG